MENASGRQEWETRRRNISGKTSTGSESGKRAWDTTNNNEKQEWETIMGRMNGKPERGTRNITWDQKWNTRVKHANWKQERETITETGSNNGTQGPQSIMGNKNRK